MSMKYILKDDL